jgi:hypothetical protein
VKRIVSISVGSSARDHITRHTFLGQECEISRRGTNGDFQKAIELYKELDGKVDAFGAGGVEFFLEVEDKKYYFRDVKRIRDAIKISKVGDGNGVKGFLEKRAFEYLEKYLNEKEGRSLKGLPALKTTVVERYSMGKAMVDAGLDVTFGDFMFALGLPIPMRSLRAARMVASALVAGCYASAVLMACIRLARSRISLRKTSGENIMSNLRSLPGIFCRSANTCQMT